MSYPWHVKVGCLIGILLIESCTPRSRVFRTPYDKELRRALRRQKGGWVMRGPTQPASTPSTPVIQPDQFFQAVLELPQAIGKEEQLSTTLRLDTLRVYEDSLAYLPWAGSVRLGGLTLDSAQALLEARAQQIFRSAQVRLYPLYPYYMFGEVTTQGRLLLNRREIPLFEVLGLMNFPTFSADLSRVKVIRGARVYLVDVRDAQTITGAFMLQTGDIVYVPPQPLTIIRTEFQTLSLILSILQIANFVILLTVFF
ncbi:MAG: hypothetical protein ABDH91_08535 [Bacteroidia bacterium]